MSVADDLLRLQKLRNQGALTDREFADAKAVLFAGGQSAGDDATLIKRLAELELQQELMQLDREWDQEHFRLTYEGANGGREVPTRGKAKRMLAFAVVVGVAFLSCSVLSGADSPAGSLWIPGVLFLLFGGFIAWSCHVSADRYEKAYERHRQRRDSLAARSPPETAIRDLTKS